MQLWYRNLAFEENGATIALSKDAVPDENGMVAEYRVRWDVEAVWTGDNYQQVAQKFAVAEKTLSIPYGNLVFRGDGGETIRALLNAGSLSGVVISSIRTPPNRGAEGVNRQTMFFTAEATYPGAGQLQVVSYQESVGGGGGLPIRDMMLDVNGAAPIVQVVYPRSPFRAHQRGQATGLTAYPPREPPIWPNPWEQNWDQVSGRRRGAALSHFTTTWDYSWLSPVPLVALPHQPPLR